jgi:arylsulfatase
LLFGSDRGLRDGDWKLVSFQSDPWELYNVAKDRTELHNIAAQHPDMVSRMAKQWTDMAANVLHSPAKQYAPVASTASELRRHREWTDYASLGASTDRHDAAKNRKRAAKKGKGENVRARAGTTLRVQDDQFLLQCEGRDPGLAFDALTPLPAAGPYTLEFRLQSHASGDGELFWTTDDKTPLPKGGHTEFPVKHDGEWQTMILKIPETKSIHGLRLDPCAGPGNVTIAGLLLKNATGETLKSWP